MSENELMTLAEAYEKAADDDIISNMSYCTKYEHTKKNFSQLEISGVAAASKCWQIIPAEPMVLDLIDIADSHGKSDGDLGFGEACHQNGRLERDLEFKELLEECNEINDLWDANIKIDEKLRIHRITTHVKNLPPLNIK